MSKSISIAKMSIFIVALMFAACSNPYLINTAGYKVLHEDLSTA